MQETKGLPHDGDRSHNINIITWRDLDRIERAVLPLLIMCGRSEGEERDHVPPQSLVRVILRLLWGELTALSRRVGGGQ